MGGSSKQIVWNPATHPHTLAWTANNVDKKDMSLKLFSLSFWVFNGQINALAAVESVGCCVGEWREWKASGNTSDILHYRSSHRHQASLLLLALPVVSRRQQINN